MLIEKIMGSIEDYDTNDLEEDKVILDHEELTKPHQRVTTEAGRDLAVSLPIGDNLFYGAVLYVDKDLIIIVDAAEEEFLELYPKDNIQWSRASFNIGNMHSTLYINESTLVTPYDPAIERIIKSLDIVYDRKTGKLEGIRANVNQIHAHSHSHSHYNSDKGNDNE